MGQKAALALADIAWLRDDSEIGYLCSYRAGENKRPIRAERPTKATYVIRHWFPRVERVKEYRTLSNEIESAAFYSFVQFG